AGEAAHTDRSPIRRRAGAGSPDEPYGPGGDPAAESRRIQESMVTALRRGTAEVDTDAILVRRVARGEEGALEEVYDRLGGVVYGLAVRSLGDPQLAEECMQDVFASVWRTAGRFDRSRGSLGTWVVALARNRIVDAAR